MSFAGTSRVGLSFSFPPLRRCSRPGDAMELFVSPHNVCKNLLNIQWNIRGCNFGNGTSPVIFSCLSLPVNSLSMVPTYLMPRVKILQNGHDNHRYKRELCMLLQNTGDPSRLSSSQGPTKQSWHQGLWRVGASWRSFFCLTLIWEGCKHSAFAPCLLISLGRKAWADCHLSSSLEQTICQPLCFHRGAQCCHWRCVLAPSGGNGADPHMWCTSLSCGLGSDTLKKKP